MEMRRLMTFKAVAERLNFTRAAEDLHLAQSSVSAQISSLEEELGVRLFDRIGKRTLLTEAGEKLLRYALRMQSMSEEIRAELSESDELAGALTIRTPETVASQYMPEVVERFLAEHPRVELNFINCDDVRLREELNSGRIDLAFLLTDSVNQSNVTVDMLRAEPLALLAAPGHPLAAKGRIGSDDLNGQTLLHLRVD